MRLSRTSTRVLLITALGIAVLAVAVVIARAVVEQRLRSRIEAVLRDRVSPPGRVEAVRLHWDGSVTVEQLSLASPDVDARLAIRRIQLAPKLRELLRGRVELENLRVEGVTLEGSQLDRFRPSIRSGSGAASSTSKGVQVPPGPLQLELSDVTISTPQGRWRIASGALEVAGDRNSVAGTVRLEPGVISFELKRAGPSRDLRLELVDVALPALLQPVTDKVLGGTLSGTLRVEKLDERLSLAVNLRATALNLHVPRLSPEPTGAFSAGVNGTAAVKLSEREVATDGLTLSLGEGKHVKATLQGRVSLKPPAEAQLKLEAREVDFNELLQSLPPTLSLSNEVISVTGTFGAQLAFVGTRELPKLTGRFDLSRLKAGRKDLPPYTLTLPFTFQVPEGPTARAREVVVALHNPNFVPLEDIPQFLIRTVLLSEDSSFYTHQGFDFAALAGNFFAPPEDSKVVRGGSTLSQQLAKNLFLSREKTYARKIQEALATLALEATLSKERLLEIYLNVIEWGPDLRGIGEASEHYFRKRVDELSVREMAFLASIIPNPVRYHGYCRRGALTPAWDARLEALLRKLNGAGVISDAELQTALAETLQFKHPETDGREPLEEAED